MRSSGASFLKVYGAMSDPKIIMLEPSKVGTQHITMINPYLDAVLAATDRPVEFWCAASMWDNVSDRVKPSVRHRAVPVIDPSSRRFLIKIPLEVLVTVWAILRKKRDDVLLITCLFSPALYLVSLACQILRPRHVHVVLHSEVEALLDPSLSPKITGYGYWINKFWDKCLHHTAPKLVVIDSFVRDRLLAFSKSRLQPERLNVLTMPIALPDLADPEGSQVPRSDLPKVCFIGYRTRLKGFEIFQDLAASRKDFAWYAIGGGVIEDMANGEVTPLASADDFGAAVSSCDIAVFPYKGGYNVSMSAAVLDAVSSGLHVIGSPLGCFMALSEAFGEDVVRCAEGVDEINAALDNWLVLPDHPTRADYARIIASSRFSQENLNAEMRRLIDATSDVTTKGVNSYGT